MNDTGVNRKDNPEAVAGNGGADSPPAPSEKKDISALADPNCKKCHGTGRVGWIWENGERRILACQCVKQNVFQTALKEEVERLIEKNGGTVGLNLRPELLKKLGIETEDV